MDCNEDMRRATSMFKVWKMGWTLSSAGEHERHSQGAAGISLGLKGSLGCGALV